MNRDHPFKPKILTTLQNYSFAVFQKDLFSALIVALIAIPMSIAFGIASGVSPAQGILTAVVGGFFISLLGGSRVQIGGPTGAFIVIVSGIVAQYSIGGLIVATFMAGIILVVLGAFKFGTAVRFIPQPIIIGFTAGIAVTIFLSQVKDLLGLSVNKLPSEFFAKIAVLFQNLGTTNFWALGVGVVTLVLVAVFSRFGSKFPGAFVAIVLATVSVSVFHLPVPTIESLYGKVELAISPLSFDGLTYQSILNLVPAAFTIAFLGAVESLLSASVADGMSSGRHRPNTELVAQGVANVASSLVGGIPATGAIARTATNVRNGGKTPVAGVLHAIFLLLIMLFLSSYAALIPMASLAGLLVYVCYRMAEWKEFQQVFRTTRSDALALVTTFAVTVFVDLVYAIISGLIVASFLFIRNVALASKTVETHHEHMEDLPGTNDLDLPPGTYVLDLSGAFFFGAASAFEESIRPLLPHAQTLILRMDEVSLLDATGTRVLHRILKDAKASRVRVVLTEIQPTILQVMEHAELIQEVGVANMFASFDGAVKDVRSSQPLVFSTRPQDATIDPI